MALSFDRAKAYVYRHGVLWQRVLFAHLFEDAPLAHVHQCLACYKNPDSGWGHGLEPDIKTPDSHPLAMEFALQIFRVTEISANNLFNDAPEWLEMNRQLDGSLVNPESVLLYPCAPWWQKSCGLTTPTSIVGNLVRLGIGTPLVLDSTSQWVQNNITLDDLRSNDGLCMAHHGYDYFMHIDDFPEVEIYRKAVIENMLALAEAAAPEQYYQFFLFAGSPDTPLARATPPKLLKKLLSALAKAQNSDGAWEDEHQQPEWYPWTTIVVLNALKNHGIWSR